jgi:hypothetical protein
MRCAAEMLSFRAQAGLISLISGKKNQKICARKKNMCVAP